MLIPTATFPLSFEYFAYLYTYFYFPLLFLRCSVYHCSYRFWNNSKSKAIWAMLLLTALSLWQMDSNKGRLSSESQHRYNAIKCTFKSLRWLISPKRKKTYAPLYTWQYLCSFPFFRVVWVWVFFPSEILRP